MLIPPTPCGKKTRKWIMVIVKISTLTMGAGIFSFNVGYCLLCVRGVSKSTVVSKLKSGNAKVILEAVVY